MQKLDLLGSYLIMKLLNIILYDHYAPSTWSKIERHSQLETIQRLKARVCNIIGMKQELIIGRIGEYPTQYRASTNDSA